MARISARMPAILGAMAMPLLAFDMPDSSLRGGVKMGYGIGQHGNNWPIKSPLKNDIRGGFYIQAARLGADFPIDSSFRISGTLNFAKAAPVEELYLDKALGNYRIRLGQFAGAGLRTGPGTDEFDYWTIHAPFYAQNWSSVKQWHGWWDLGVQVERFHADGRFRHRLFVHNANRNVSVPREGVGFIGPSTQALGFDYAWEWQVTGSSVLGGHAGALANKEWDEFLGGDFWEANRWFRENSLVDGSLFHEFGMGRLWVQSEGMAILNRNFRSPPDSTAMKTWGVSVLARYAWNPTWQPFARYEFFDPTDGIVPNDALHLLSAGLRYSLRAGSIPCFWTLQYSRVYEEGVQQILPNDAAYGQFQARF